MAKAELSGTVTAFRHSKFKQDSYQTIVQMANAEDAPKVVGSRTVWSGKNGLQIHGRVVARADVHVRSLGAPCRAAGQAFCVGHGRRKASLEEAQQRS